jgi:hypothetical protein
VSVDDVRAALLARIGFKIPYRHDSPCANAYLAGVPWGSRAVDNVPVDNHEIEWRIHLRRATRRRRSQDNDEVDETSKITHERPLQEFGFSSLHGSPARGAILTELRLTYQREKTGMNTGDSRK